MRAVRGINESGGVSPPLGRPFKKNKTTKLDV
jgi:hypothetical protein